MVERIFGEWNSATQRSKFDARTETDVRLVLAGGEPVGAVYLEDKPDGALDISLIEIDPAHQNQGLGGATIQRLAAEAAAADRAVTLGVRKLNPAAKRLYERLGFRVIGDDETHFRMRREPGAESGSDSLGPSTA